MIDNEIVFLCHNLYYVHMSRNPQCYPISSCEWVSVLNRRAGNTAYVTVPKAMIYTYALRPGMAVEATITGESESETWRPTLNRRCGNSVSITVPKGIIQNLGLHLGAKVKVKLENMTSKEGQE